MSKKQDWKKFIGYVKSVEELFDIKDLIWHTPVICYTDRPTQVKIMVITEESGEMTKNCISYFNEKGKNTPVRINELLKGLKGLDFKECVEKRKGPFYWTHAIKYPLKYGACRGGVTKYFMKKKVMKKELDEKGNTYFLKKEIEILAPKLIIIFGGTAFSLCKFLADKLFANFIEGNKLQDIVDEEKKKKECFSTNYLFEPKNEVKIIYLPHPSGANRDWNKIEEDKTFTEKIRKQVNKTLGEK